MALFIVSVVLMTARITFDLDYSVGPISTIGIPRPTRLFDQAGEMIVNNPVPPDLELG